MQYLNLEFKLLLIIQMLLAKVLNFDAENSK